MYSISYISTLSNDEVIEWGHAFYRGHALYRGHAFYRGHALYNDIA